MIDFSPGYELTDSAVKEYFSRFRNEKLEIDHGDNCQGTVLHRTSQEFRSIFDSADVIISKG